MHCQRYAAIILQRTTEIFLQLFSASHKFMQRMHARDGSWQLREERDPGKVLRSHTSEIKGAGFDHAGYAENTVTIAMQ